MTMVLVRNWWAYALRGTVAVLFGFGALVFPGITLAVVVAMFAIYAMVDGALAVVAAVRAAERNERSWSQLWKGVLGIATGVAALGWPRITALVFLYLVGIWAVVTGILEVRAGLHLRRSHGEWLLVANGALSVLFGLLIVTWPGAGLLSVIWMIGGYAIFFGLLMFVVASRLRFRQRLNLRSAH